MSKLVTIGEYYISLEAVQIPIGLKLDVVRASGVGLSIKGDDISAPSPGKLEVLISEAALGAFLNCRSPGGLKDFEVSLTDSKVRVKATLKVIVEIRATAVCTLRIEGGTQIFVDLESVEALGASPKNLVQQQLEKINPIFDVADLPFDAQLESAKIEDGVLTLLGSISPKQG